MSTKTKILKVLEENRSINISGEQIANSIGISRSAVWKAINELKKDGYEIHSSTNKGYRLSCDNDIISSEGIKLFLKNDFVQDIFVYKSLQSTNKTAKQLALDFAKNGTVVIANEQTNGRGRMGRSFFSPPDTGIYMSIILRPNTTVQNAALITTLASVAVCSAIEKVLNINTSIKWVNDILLNGKKICGILTEAATDFESGNIDYVVLGIGINFCTEKKMFPIEIINTAESLFDKKKSGYIRNHLIAEIINEISEKMDYIVDEIKSKEIIYEYKKRSIVVGKNIEIIQNNNIRHAKALDIDEHGGLVVQLKNNEVETLTSGEISIRGDFYNDNAKIKN